MKVGEAVKGATPVVLLTVNNFGECDKWYNLNDNINYDVVCIWMYRGMTEQMYDYFCRVVKSGYSVQVIVPSHAVKFDCKKKKDVDAMCSIYEMMFD